MRRGAARWRTAIEQAAYLAGEALASFRRNGLMTVAAVTTMMVALLVVGIAVVLGLNLSHLATTLESRVAVVAFLRDGLLPAELIRAQRMIEALPGVIAVRFVSRAEALVRLRQHLNDTAAFDDLEVANPLPDSLEVQVADLADVKATAATVAEVVGVEEVTYGTQAMDRLLALTQGLRLLAAVLTLFLTAVALIVVVNTVRLTVIARHREIEIMQLVGATRWFIQGPLLLEGILEGGVASAAATVVLGVCYLLAVSRVSSALPFLPLMPTAAAVYGATIGMTMAGIVVGATGSLVAVRRFVSP